MSDPAPRGGAVSPYLLYEDVAGALDWLGRVFGFRERLRFADDDGTVTHAEMFVADGVVMLGDPGPDYESPRRHGKQSHLVHVYVDDVDGHYRRAKEAGARILSEPEDRPHGDRMYMAEDLEGHHWAFSQTMREVPPAEWGAATP